MFMLLRRTQAQTDLISKPEFSPVNPVMEYLSVYPIIESASKYSSLIYSIPDPESEEKTFRGYTGALSTFSNMRGFDGSKIQTAIVDEFIPEVHERPIKNEFECAMNIYETINRNRELTGNDPLQMLFLANSNRLNSPIMAGLGLVKVLERMESTGQTEYIKQDRGIAIFLLTRSEISKAKAN